jgi:hypothetical protein
MLSPLTGLVDAVPPDSEVARKFTLMIDGLLSDAPRFQLYRQEISNALADWHASSLALNPMIDRSPALEEARPLVPNLADLAIAGEEALAYLESGTTPTTEWRNVNLARITEAAKPKAALEFVVISSLTKLVNAAADQPNSKSTSPAELKR